jgi:hypothetical protein
MKQELKEVGILVKDLLRSLAILAAQQVILRLANESEYPVCIHMTTEKSEVK